MRLSAVRDSDIPSWADFPPSKWRLTGRIKSGDVLIWSGGTGSGLSLIIEKGEALWAIAFVMGRGANRTVHSLIWNSSLIFMNYELDSVVKKKLHLHNPSDRCYMFYVCCYYFQHILQLKSFILISLLMHTESIQFIQEWTMTFIYIYSYIQKSKYKNWQVWAIYIFIYMYWLWIILYIIYVCCHIPNVYTYTMYACLPL